MKHFSTLTLFLTLTLLLNSCCREELLNLTTAKDIVKHYYEDGQFDKELDKIVADAKKQFDKIEVKPNSAVIFDVDDTVLLNYEGSKKMGYGYVKNMVDEWVSTAQVPAILQVKDLYDYLLQRNVKIIFLTGRFHDEYEYTFQNLINEGFTTFDTLIVRRAEEQKLPAIEFKSNVRTALTQKGYDIIGNVGDQWTDLDGLYSGTKIKIPNYLYITKQ
ncbi:MAG: HAD family acid phosphatase [Ignavibacteriaceae bacterium]